MTGDEIIALINNPATTMTINRDRGSFSFMSKTEHHKTSMTDHHDWQSVLASSGVTSVSKFGSATLFHGGVVLEEGTGVSITESVPHNGLIVGLNFAALDAAYVNVGGDTMTGPLDVNIPGGNNLLGIYSGDATPTYYDAGISIGHNGIMNWKIFRTANAIGHLRVERYDSAGVFVSRSFQIRSDRDEIVANDSLRVKGTYKAGPGGSFYTGAVDPTNTNRGNYDGYMHALRFYNAIYNDVADFIDAPEGHEVKYGFPYTIGKDGGARVATKGERSVGIASDTYGVSNGHVSGKSQIPISVAGFALAHVDDEYEFMCPLVVGKGSILTKANLLDRIIFRDRIVGWFFKPEKSSTVYNETVNVNGRSWIKVK